MADANEAERALQRDLVRRGYDAISHAYRDDAGRSDPEQPGESTDPYAGWVAELAALLRPRARVLDLGCGAGVPATKLLAARNFDVLGLDISAVQVAREFRPQVILLDIGLPDVDGYTVADRLRGEGLAGDLLVALTGYGPEEDRERARQAGFDRHLMKPVDPNALLDLFRASSASGAA